MKTLVIGGAGFIGLNLSEALLAAGHCVRILERAGVQPPEFLRNNPRLEWVNGDFAVDSDIERALEGQEYVFHLASSTLPKTSNDNPRHDVISNVVATLGVLQKSKEAGVRRIVFVSSGGTVYGQPQSIPITETHPNHPLSSYGICKLTIEKYLELFWHLHQLPYLVYRLSNPYGRFQRPSSAQGAVTVFLARALRGETIEIWGDGSVIRDYIYISDAVSGLMTSLAYSGRERIFNLGSGIGTSLNELLAIVSTIVGTPPNVIYKPSRSFDVERNILDINKLSRETGWAPKVNLYDGLKLTKDFLTKGDGI
ncbi:NAD-dependent epimerase/dehydratase family protein [Bosea caraganae]|uniref:NAD-dependent epimerase/dehydratase family protein n=1 Tax=Bosea caraganae TaxID=2763117 RepID=A0A370L6M5_9HYPH|nr:NAD-dependent epimerase/dehydratase family protein [Bosea caraganae]RDJ25405.1 NAD-dependent epimerase/dehydratase family protein [Bosea caraganae]RDJ25810.1 NAD-dependent epimerase/dehydratase family protein [Bosea caraganae]